MRIDLFRSPKVMLFPKLVLFSLLHTEAMKQYIVQHQKFVSTSTWPCYFLSLVPGLPVKEGNYCLILINLSKIDLFWCPFPLFPFLVWCLSTKDFPEKLFLCVDGFYKAHASLTAEAFILIYFFFIKDEEQKTNPFKRHYSAVKHNNDHILTCIVH